jgi:hypothetical protein
MTDTVFCVQDATGTVAQLTIAAHPADIIAVGDTGTYKGTLDTDTPLAFTVGQVLNQTQFGITTQSSDAATWAPQGEITWVTGANATATSTVTNLDGANAYITPDMYLRYHRTRGNILASPLPSEESLQASIVRGTDYLENKYRYKGIKLLQSVGNPNVDPNMAFLDPYLSPFGVGSLPFYSASTSSQSTQWPRQGVVDYNGDTVNGIPVAIMQACAELAYRDQTGVALQPDYDPAFVGAGGIIQSISEEVGPIKTSKSFDTRMGIGFFATFPQVDAILQKAGLLMAGGGRTVMR